MDIVLSIASVTIFMLMLTIGLNHPLKQLIMQKRDLLVRGLLSVLVLVPAIAFVLLLVFDLPPESAGAIAILAAAPGAPLTTKRSQMAGADLELVSSLQLASALLAILVTPIILSIFNAAFALPIEEASPAKIASQVASVTLLPVIIGLTVTRLAPSLVERFGGWVTAVANALFLIMIMSLIVVVFGSPEIWSSLLLEPPVLIALLILAVAAVFFGYALGGPRNDRRAGLAIASLARNIGLAAFIAALGPDPSRVLPTILAFMFVGIAVQIPFAIWIKRQNPTG